MVNMTLSIPEELHKRMRKLSEIKWSEVARRAIEERVNDLETLNKLLANSKLTEKDALEIGRKIKKGIAERHGLYETSH